MCVCVCNKHVLSLSLYYLQKSKANKQEKSHELLREHLKKLKEGDQNNPDRDFMLKVIKLILHIDHYCSHYCR